jgi:hypothetical protein
MNTKTLVSTAAALALALSLAVPTRAWAYARLGRWDASTSAVYPVVRAYSCPNQFARFFSQPWDSVRRQLLSAANEWFVGGGSDLRIRVQPDLPASDPRCQDVNPTMNPGEILVTAERNNGGGSCYLATTFWWVNGASLTQAKVIMHSGTACGGSYQPYAWSNGDYPGVGQYDFWSVFAHELGHAIGFLHSGEATAVMLGSAPNGDSQRRFLSSDDRAGLRDAALAYPRTETALQHRRSTDDGASWHSEGEPLGLSVIGAPAICAEDGVSARPYLVASTRAADDTLYTFRTNGVSRAGDATPALTSQMAPAVGCRSGAFVLASVATDVDRNVQVATSSDGTTWSAGHNVGVSSGLPPALAYASWNQRYVLLASDPFTGRLRTLLSTDNGQTWSAPSEWTFFRTSSAPGITCQASGQYCNLTWSDAQFSHTPLRSATIRFDASGALYLDADYHLGFNSYGGGVASNANRFQHVWRDRGTATVLTAGGWPWPATLAPLTFTPDIAHAPPTIAWGAPWSEWSAWYSFATRYDR